MTTSPAIYVVAGWLAVRLNCILADRGLDQRNWFTPHCPEDDGTVLLTAHINGNVRRLCLEPRASGSVAVHNVETGRWATINPMTLHGITGRDLTDEELSRLIG